MTALSILCPLDGSQETFEAVKRGLPMLAGKDGLNVTFLVVMDAKILGMPESAREHLEFDDEDEIFLREDEARAVLKKAEGLAAKVKGVKAKSVTVKGHVFDEIMAAARSHDVLLMHGLDATETHEKASGAMTERLARQAECAVLLVR
jgi:nucleotide-binding universal stress UspA family protein